MSTMNSWETSAFQAFFKDDVKLATSLHTTIHDHHNDGVHDSVIYPGLYSYTGLDVMGILLQVVGRPSPKIDLGPIDTSCAFVLCDLLQPDKPVVYVSDAFSELTGYHSSEVLGRNCRFLQEPGGRVRRSSSRKYVHKDTISTMQRAVETNDECALEVLNFRKDGSSFVNILAMVPIQWDGQGYRYSVGFLAAKE